MKNTVVIFDLDGTLLNTDSLIFASFRYAFSLYLPEYELSDEELYSFLGPTLHDSFRRYMDEETTMQAKESYRLFNRQHHCDYVTIYEGVEETLQTLKDNDYPLAVLTTKREDMAQYGLELFHIKDYFDEIVGMDALTKVKPDPEGIYLIQERTHCQQAIMIGDNVSDLMAGKNAGVKTYGMNWTPKGPEAMQALLPDGMLNDMRDLLTYMSLS